MTVWQSLDQSPCPNPRKQEKKAHKKEKHALDVSAAKQEGREELAKAG